uniref:Ubiquitin-like domain-containing protein n=1 Tax=Zooxanthella nutricula TaxID=1333877 RepID=A0A7S2IM47_9DINO
MAQAILAQVVVPGRRRLFPKSQSTRRAGMAAALVEAMSELAIAEPEASPEAVPVRFKVSGLDAFDMELDLATTARDIKKLAKEQCGIEPEHMRLIYEGRVLKDSDDLACYKVEGDSAVQIHFTAGHSALLGGSVPQRVQKNPFSTPVRGLPGSKGHRTSRMSGRLGGMALIRKYGILMKRQEFREKAEQIGFVKYR